MNDRGYEPCPFCGSEGIWCCYHGPVKYVVFCEECGTAIKGATLEEAKKLWNRRATTKGNGWAAMEKVERWARKYRDFVVLQLEREKPGDMVNVYFGKEWALRNCLEVIEEVRRKGGVMEDNREARVLAAVKKNINERLGGPQEFLIGDARVREMGFKDGLEWVLHEIERERGGRT